MASYRLRPDGTAELVLDSGRAVATALSPEELDAAGVPATPAEAQPALYAEPGFQPPPPRVGTEGIAQRLTATPTGAPTDPFGLAGPSAPPLPLAAAPLPPQPPAPRAPTPAEQAAGMSFAPPARPLVSQAAPTAGMAPTTRGGAREQLIQDVLEYQSSGGGPARTIPEHWVPTTEQRRMTGAGWDPETQEQIDESRLERQLAAQEVSETTAEAADVRRMLATQEAIRAQEERERAVERKAFIDSEFSKRMQTIDTKLRAIQRGNELGTPRERVMQRRGWFSNLLATIGTVMAAPAMQYLGGRNLAQEAIDREVEDEVQRQKDLYQEAQDQRTVLKDMIDAGMSPQTAEQTVRLLAKEEAATRLAAWASRSESNLIRKNFDMWLAEDALGRAREYAAIKDQTAGEVVRGAKFVPTKTVGGPSQPMDPLKRLLRGAQAAQYADVILGGGGDTKEQRKALEKARAQYVEGEGFARTETEAQKLREAKGAKDNLIALANQTLETRRAYAGGEIDLKTAQARLRSLSAQAADENRLFRGAGTLDEGYINAWENMFGNPALPKDPAELASRMFLRDADEQVRTFREGVQRNWERSRPTNFTSGPAEIAGVPAQELKTATPR